MQCLHLVVAVPFLRDGSLKHLAKSKGNSSHANGIATRYHEVRYPRSIYIAFDQQIVENPR
jgi:hypothetical protein